MYQDHTPLQIAGQLAIATAFLATGLRNVFWKFGQHLDRMVASGVPQAKAVLVTGFLVQFAGATLVALDYRRALGAGLLIGFTAGGSRPTRWCATCSSPPCS
jgi:uncharacterized membrane protein YphA (DoxX/SURF4 family)